VLLYQTLSTNLLYTLKKSYNFDRNAGYTCNKQTQPAAKTRWLY